MFILWDSTTDTFDFVFKNTTIIRGIMLHNLTMGMARPSPVLIITIVTGYLQHVSLYPKYCVWDFI